jgi:GNAT superfamily N-acetyltransferase
MQVSVVVVEKRGQLDDWLTVRNELEPDEPLRFEQLLARRDAEPERRELLAAVGDEIAGIGSVGPKDEPRELAYGYIGVRDAWRQRGIESAVLAEIREIARAWERSRLELWAREDDGDLVAFLEGHGFVEVMREGGLALDIEAGPSQATLPLPGGVVIEAVAARGELADGAYEVATQTWRDIPGETGIEERAAWLRLHVEGAAGGAVVAVHRRKVVGFAGLYRLAGEGLYEHDLLAVLPAYRRRGIARAMKTAQLQWLRKHGARRVVTWNAEANEAARALNLSLGYRPLPSSIAFQGPI